MSQEKRNRNKRIYRRSKLGGGMYSVRELAREYKLSPGTVQEIVEREHAKLSL